MRARRLFLALLIALACAPGWALAGARAARAADPCAAGEQYFPETQRCASASFAAYWIGHGGLAQQGYPVSKAFDEVNPSDGKSYRVQYFERARFESHPENAAPYAVLLGLLGAEQHKAKYPGGSPARGGACLPGEQDFAQTKHCVGARFAAYWALHGGLEQQGYPISDEFDEVNPSDGKSYRVQYFERARFEYHPENQAPFDVLLGLLGNEQYRAKYAGGQPGQSPAPSGSPAPGSPILFRDNFTDPNSGWPTGKFPNGAGEVGYANGGYRIGIAAPNFSYFPTNRTVGDLGNVQIETDVVKVGGPDNTPFGVQCRVKDTDNLYAALYDGRGYAAIYKFQAGRVLPLVTTVNKPSPALKAGNTTNHVRFDCVGSVLTFYANGQKILETQDTAFAAGRIGFAGVTTSQGGLDITFRTLVVSGPSGGPPATAPQPAPTAGDTALMASAAQLVRESGGRPIVQSLDENKVSWVFAPLSGAYGKYSASTYAITYSELLRTFDPHDLGAVIGHEGTHAADYFASGPVRTTQECYNREARGFAASAALWKSWYGAGGKASPANDFEQDMNTILGLLQSDPQRFATLLANAYKAQCEAMIAMDAPDGRAGAGVPASLDGLPTYVRAQLPEAERLFDFLARGAALGPDEGFEDDRGVGGMWR